MHARTQAQNMHSACMYDMHVHALGQDAGQFTESVRQHAYVEAEHSAVCVVQMLALQAPTKSACANDPYRPSNQIKIDTPVSVAAVIMP